MLVLLLFWVSDLNTLLGDFSVVFNNNPWQSSWRYPVKKKFSIQVLVFDRFVGMTATIYAIVVRYWQMSRQIGYFLKKDVYKIAEQYLKYCETAESSTSLPLKIYFSIKIFWIFLFFLPFAIKLLRFDYFSRSWRSLI